MSDFVKKSKENCGQHRGKALWKCKSIKAAFFLAALTALQPAQASDPYPTRPIKIIVAFAAGGPGDIVARALSGPLSETLGQPVVVENRPGGDTSIGTEVAAKAPPDGYTIMQVTSTHAINTVLKENFRYDLFKDFSPVARVVRSTLVLVTSGNSPYKSVSDLAAAGKSKTKNLSYGSGATGSVGHLSSELFKRAVGIDALHVPYKGGGAVLTDLAAGRLDFFFSTQAESVPNVNSGLLRALAVTAPQRVQTLPNVPTMIESGYPGFNPSIFYGYMVPANTPAPIVKRLHEAIAKSMASKSVQDRMQTLGLISDPGGPEALAETMVAETERWSQVIKSAKIRAE